MAANKAGLGVQAGGQQAVLGGQAGSGSLGRLCREHLRWGKEGGKDFSEESIPE